MKKKFCISTLKIYIFFFPQGSVYTGTMLLYRNGVLSVRAAVRGTPGWKTNPTLTPSGLGQTDRIRNELSALA